MAYVSCSIIKPTSYNTVVPKEYSLWVLVLAFFTGFGFLKKYSIFREYTISYLHVTIKNKSSSSQAISIIYNLEWMQNISTLVSNIMRFPINNNNRFKRFKRLFEGLKNKTKSFSIKIIRTLPKVYYTFFSLSISFLYS